MIYRILRKWKNFFFIHDFSTLITNICRLILYYLNQLRIPIRQNILDYTLTDYRQSLSNFSRYAKNLQTGKKKNLCDILIEKCWKNKRLRWTIPGWNAWQDPHCWWTSPGPRARWWSRTGASPSRTNRGQRPQRVGQQEAGPLRVFLYKWAHRVLTPPPFSRRKIPPSSPLR